MAVILEFQPDKIDRKQLFREAMEDGDILLAIKELCLDLEQDYSISSEVNLAQLYTIIGRIDFSNKILFNLLSLGVDDDLIYLVISSNMRIMGDKTLANFYMEKCISKMASEVEYSGDYELKITALKEEAERLSLESQFKIVSSIEKQKAAIKEKFDRFFKAGKYKQCLEYITSQNTGGDYDVEVALAYIWVEDYPKAKEYFYKSISKGFGRDRIVALHYLIEICIEEFDAAGAKKYIEMIENESIAEMDTETIFLLCKELIFQNRSNRVIEIATNMLIKGEQIYEFTKCLAIAYYNLGQSEKSIFEMKQIRDMYYRFTDCDELIYFFRNYSAGSNEQLFYYEGDELPEKLCEEFSIKAEKHLQDIRELGKKAISKKNATDFVKILLWKLKKISFEVFIADCDIIDNLTPELVFEIYRKILLDSDSFEDDKVVNVLSRMFCRRSSKIFLVSDKMIKEINYKKSKAFCALSNIHDKSFRSFYAYHAYKGVVHFNVANKISNLLHTVFIECESMSKLSVFELMLILELSYTMQLKSDKKSVEEFIKFFDIDKAVLVNVEAIIQKVNGEFNGKQ